MTRAVARFGRRLLLAGLTFVLACLYRRLVRPHPKRLGAILGLEAPPRSPLPFFPAAVFLRCTFCQRETVHFREDFLYVCVNRDEHPHTFPYRALAASLPDASRYAGCICEPGELRFRGGAPDPRCHGAAHRP